MKLKTLLAMAAVSLTALAGRADGSTATFNGSMLYGYCTTAYSANTFPTGTLTGEAMQMNASALRYFQGCKITAIAVANGALADNATSTTLPIDLFVTPTLGGEATQTMVGEMDLTKTFEYTEYALPEPIEIYANMDPFYVGFTVRCDQAVGFPIVTDGRYDETAGPGDWIGLASGEGEDLSWEWEQARAMAGMCCVRVKIEGPRLPANDVSIIDGHIPTFAAPGSENQISLYLRNDAGNTVENVQIEYVVNGGEPQTTTLNLPRPLLYNDMTTQPVGFNITMPDAEGADLPLSVKVTGVNGEPNGCKVAQCSEEGTYLSLRSGFEKNMVAEVTTGTWCGWCPIGMNGISKMLETYPEGRFIPIAVHLSDEMSEQSYNKLATTLTGQSAPTCVVNRNMETYGVQTPSFEYFSAIYPEIIATPALARPTVKSMTYDAAKKRLNVEADVEFAIDTEGEYALAFVITENEVGPYVQHNYYSPEKREEYGAGELEGWSDRPYEVEMTFNEVARYIYSFLGIKNSLPAQLKAGETYSYSAAVPTNLVSNLENASVTVLVTNRKSGRIENAVRVPYADQSSIDAVEAVPSERVEYYDLQGRRVAAPAAGRIYIERRGSQSSKVRI